VVAGAAPIGDDGRTVGLGDVSAQTRRCIDIAEREIKSAGLSLDTVIRTRSFSLTYRGGGKPPERMASASRRPVTTFVEVSRFIDPEWLVEIELDCMAR
jgi:enamine deaminase RidA (YjgF/YER057c/UK114 family)